MGCGMSRKRTLLRGRKEQPLAPSRSSDRDRASMPGKGFAAETSSSSSSCDQVDTLCLELQKRGFVCWYDNQMSSLTKEAMADGIRNACYVLLFLSAGVLTRPYVLFEIEEAVKCGRPITLMHEADERHQPFNFAKDLLFWFLKNYEDSRGVNILLMGG